jgi:hypothetical protein
MEDAMSKKYAYTILATGLAALALAACSARSTVTPPTDEPAATATNPSIPTVTQPAPTHTVPAPTATAVAPTPTTVPPTEAPVVTEPAPTDAAPATPDPNEGVGDVIYADPLDGTSGWNWGFSDDAVTFGVENGVLKGTMTTSEEWWRFSLGPDRINAGSQQVRVTANSVACEGQDEYGLVFRGAERAAGGYDLYVFKMRCDGAARFEKILNGETTVLADWATSDAIAAGAGAQNTLVAWMNGGAFRFYVNDQYLFSAQDDQLASGYYGFYLMDRSEGGLTVTFDDLLARQVNAAAASQ